jgi:hypothetical protein
MITILRDRKWLIRWSKPLFRTHSLQFSTTSKGYLQSASILGNFEGGDTLWEDLVKLTTCDRSSIKDRTLDVVARGSGSQSTLFLKEVGVRVPSVKSRRGKWESESPMGNIRYSGRGTHFDCISSNLRARLFDFLTSVIKSISGYRTYLASRTLARFPRRISVS